MRALLLDRPRPALDMAIFYVERVMRASSPDHKIAFRRKGIEMRWLDFLYAPLIGGLSLALLFIK